MSISNFQVTCIYSGGSGGGGLLQKCYDRGVRAEP